MQRTIIPVVTVAVIATSAHAAVSISSGATNNMSCAAGVCAPTAKDAVLNVGDLENLLTSGDVEVTTTGSGVQANNIEIEAPLTWSGTNSLTLDAYQSILVEKPVSIADAGGLSVTTNDGGSGGNFGFGAKGHVAFANLSSALMIDGASYTLEPDIKSLAAAISANSAGDYALANSYDASQDGIYTISPIGTEFGGIFEGMGNTISKLSIDHEQGADYGIGLFAVIAGTGAVEGLRLQNINYRDAVHKGGAGWVGGLVAFNLGLLFDDYVQGTITFRVAAGGLAASNVGTAGDVGTIENSSTNVNISQIHRGGLAGGLVADNHGPIAKSYAIGEVEASSAGGLVVENDETSITDSYATAQVKGKDLSGEIGGFSAINENDGSIETSYSTGKVPKKYGGFDGTYDLDFFSDCYWDASTSGTKDGVDGGNISGITGLTTQQLQSGLPAGFDPKIWAEDPKINNGLPYLIDNPPRE